MPKRRRAKKGGIETNVVTTSNTIKFETPHSQRGKKPKISVSVVPEVASRPITGFGEFIREHAIIGLAIGFIVGAQARALVDQIIKSFIDPAVGLLLGGSGNLSVKTATFHHGDKATVFGWGATAYALIDFIAVLFVVYLFIKIFKLEKLDKTAK